MWENVSSSMSLTDHTSADANSNFYSLVAMFFQVKIVPS